MKQESRPEYYSDNAFEPLVDFNDQAIEPLAKFYEGYMTCATELNEEAARFVRHRIDEDCKLSQEIAQCKNPIEIYNMQIGFCARMLSDYMQETQKMMGMVRTIPNTNGQSKVTRTSTSEIEHG